MPWRRRIAATAGSRLSSSPPLPCLAGFACLGAAPTWATARLPAVVTGAAAVFWPTSFSLFSPPLPPRFLLRSRGTPPEVRKITADRQRRITPAQVFGEDTNEVATCTTAEPIRPTSRIEPVR